MVFWFDFDLVFWFLGFGVMRGRNWKGGHDVAMIELFWQDVALGGSIDFIFSHCDCLESADQTVTQPQSHVEMVTNDITIKTPKMLIISDVLLETTQVYRIELELTGIVFFLLTLNSYDYSLITVTFLKN